MQQILLNDVFLEFISKIKVYIEKMFISSKVPHEILQKNASKQNLHKNTLCLLSLSAFYPKI